MPCAAPKLACPPGKWGESPRAGSWRTHQPGRPRPPGVSGQGDEVPQDSFQGGPVGVGAQEVGPETGESVEEVVLREGGQVAAADARESGFGSAVGEVGDVLVQGLARQGVQVLEGRRDGGKEEADGRGAEKESGGVGRADVPGGRSGDPSVGGAPGAAVPAGHFDV